MESSFRKHRLALGVKCVEGRQNLRQLLGRIRTVLPANTKVAYLPG